MAQCERSAGPEPLRHQRPVGSHAPEQVYVVARAQGLFLVNGPVAVVRGLSVQVVCAAAGDIVVGERSEYAHVLSAGKALLFTRCAPHN